MIIYGTRASKGKFVETRTQCPFCGKEHSVGILPYHKYFHVYWIPIVPYGKESIITCQDCGNVVPDHYISQEDMIEAKKKTKMPLWTFSGLAVIGASAVWILSLILFK